MIMKFLNIIYYFALHFCLFISNGIDKFTDIIFRPFIRFFLKSDFAAKRLTKIHGSIENAEKESRSAYEYVMNNEEWGFNTQFASLFYGGSIILYLWGIYSVLSHYFIGLNLFLEKNIIICIFFFIVMTGVITYFASFRNHRYKKYFKEFDKIRGLKRFLYKALTLCFIIGSFAFWIWSLGFGHH